MTEMQRKLTTVFAADVQGYSRLMEADEEGTLATLKRYREAMNRLIAAHRGRVVNTWGDAVIAEFASVVEAVRAAIDVQNELAQHNAGKPADRHMRFRIGINLGDVMIDGDDIYGDGVNIAARLQAEAPPGGILISNTVYDQVRNKVAVGFDFLGELEVKNVAEGVPSYAVRIGDAAAPASRPPSRPAPRAADPREPVPAAAPPSDIARGKQPLSFPRTAGIAGLIAILLVAINLLSGGGHFWARWPLLAIAVFVAFAWARTNGRIDTRYAGLAIGGAALVAINLMSWSGTFWAVWPLLGFAFIAGMRWIRNGGGRP